MAENGKPKDFTVFVEGHEGHQGNVLGHAYIAKLSKILTILAKMERAYLEAGQRKTDFEIVNADKYNPTTVTFKPVPKAKNYNPFPAFEWSLDQIEVIGKGGKPDNKIKSHHAKDLAELSRESNDQSYRKVWINGNAEPIHFDDNYHINALKLAKRLEEEETPVAWYEGVSQGEVVGRLEKIDNLDADHEFVIVPPIGADQIVCKFPESMEAELGRYVFKMVRVSGKVHYRNDSPHPYKIITKDGGVSLIQPRAKPNQDTLPLRQLRGLFKGAERKPFSLERML